MSSARHASTAAAKLPPLCRSRPRSPRIASYAVAFGCGVHETPAAPTLTWTGAGEVSPGDDFVWQFNQCWFDEPGEPIDELFNGTVTLENYTETVDFNTNTLFEIGFGSLSGNPGGIMFDLTLSGTVENNGVFTISPDNVIAITGGFAMIIQAP